jgi:hypothetical protein
MKITKIILTIYMHDEILSCRWRYAVVCLYYSICLFTTIRMVPYLSVKPPFIAGGGGVNLLRKVVLAGPGVFLLKCGWRCPRVIPFCNHAFISKDR